MEKIQFHRATIMPKDGSVKFLINVFEGSGDFEICESGGVVVTGKIRQPEQIDKEQTQLPVPIMKKESELYELNSTDIYKDLNLRGYEYQGIFKGILCSDNRAITGKIINFFTKYYILHEF